MKITEIELQGFRPFLLGDIRTLNWTITKPVSIICANNGVGKSSLLRELTPYPATRTDYEADGKKRLIIEHNGSTYELISDFSEKKAHSFKKDGNELNESGNTDIQEELCVSEFGYERRYQKILAGEYDFCKMTKGERRALFISLYPTDLTFISEHHKKINSKIKGFQSNIKMLFDRQSELKGQLLDEARLIELRKQVVLSTELLSKISTELVITESQLKETEGLFVDPNSNYVRTDQDQVDELYHRFNDLLKRLEKETNILTRMLDYQEYTLEVPPSDDCNKIRNQLSACQSDIDRCKEDAENLRNRLQELEECKKISTTSQKPQLLEQIERLQESLSTYEVNPEIPTLDESSLKILQDKLPAMMTCLSQINTYVLDNNHVYSEDEFKQMIDDEISLRMQCNNAQQSLEGYQVQLNMVRSRKSSLEAKLPPSGCKETVCDLKNSVNQVLIKLQKEESEILVSIDKEETLINSLKEEHNPLKEKIERYYTVQPYVKRFREIISRHSWDFFILKSTGLDFYELLNVDTLRFAELLRKIADNSSNEIHQKQIKQELSSARASLELLSKAEMPNQEVLDKVLADTRRQLDTRLEQMTSLELRDKSLTLQLKQFELVLALRNDLISLKQEYDRQTGSLLILKKLQYLQDRKNWLVEYHSRVNLELTELQKSLHSQNSIDDRLNNEITPMLEKLQKELYEYQLVESALNPVTGLTRQRMVQFMNSIIEKVNMVIKYVWTYDMEIAFLQPDDNMTFDLRPILNKRIELKDISMCSRGQRDIINLAFLLAISKELSFGSIYPLQMDEVDAQFSEIHRTNLLNLISEMIDEQWINQLFLVNHYASLYSSFNDADIVCLSEEGIVVPNEYNTHTRINE